MKLERGKVYVLNIRHDDDCRFWQRDDLSDCSCKPEQEIIEVNDDNVDQVDRDWAEGQRKAQELRALARRRN